MKTFKFEKVPKGANVLIAYDTGVLTKADEIDLYKYDGDGNIEFSFENDEDIIVRVRCANYEFGFWKPIDLRTKDFESNKEYFFTMEKAKYSK